MPYACFCADKLHFLLIIIFISFNDALRWEPSNVVFRCRDGERGLRASESRPRRSHAESLWKNEIIGAFVTVRCKEDEMGKINAHSLPILSNASA